MPETPKFSFNHLYHYKLEFSSALEGGEGRKEMSWHIRDILWAETQKQEPGLLRWSSGIGRVSLGSGVGSFWYQRGNGCLQQCVEQNEDLSRARNWFEMYDGKVACLCKFSFEACCHSLYTSSLVCFPIWQPRHAVYSDKVQHPCLLGVMNMRFGVDVSGVCTPLADGEL